MYNKRVLSTAVSELGKAKAPAKKRDNVIAAKRQQTPIVSTEGFKQGPPPLGSKYRIPGDTLYNPTPYSIEAVSDNGIRKTLNPNDTTNVQFPGATYVDEYQKEEGGEYYDDELTQEEIDDLIAQGYVVEDLTSAKVGGSLLTKKVTCKNCGWKWDAADGGDDITTCHKCGGQGLVHAQKGGSQIYKYADRPEASYKKDAKGNWLISLPSTKGEYVPIKDPTGKRAGELNEKAKPITFKMPNIVSAEEKYHDGPLQSTDWLWTLPIALPAAAQAAGAVGAMSLPGMASVPGATVGNLVNSGFIANSLFNTPENAKDWYDVSQGNKNWQDAALGSAEIAAGLYGSGAGWRSLVDDAAKLRAPRIAPIQPPVKSENERVLDHLNQAGLLPQRPVKSYGSMIGNQADWDNYIRHVYEGTDPIYLRTAENSAYAKGYFLPDYNLGLDKGGRSLRSNTGQTGLFGMPAENLSDFTPAKRWEIFDTPIGKNQDGGSLPKAQFGLGKGKLRKRKVESANSLKLDSDVKAIEQPVSQQPVPQFNMQQAMSSGCPEGYEWSSVSGECVPVKSLNLPESTVYGDPESAKEQRNLFTKLAEAKRAFKNTFIEEGYGGKKLDLPDKASIAGLKDNIQQYKKNLELEKARTEKARRALSLLKKSDSETWGDKKVKDVLNGPEAIEALRDMYAKGEITYDNFMNYYNNFGQATDPNVNQAGRNRDWSQKEAEEEFGSHESWMAYLDLMQKITYGITGVAGAGGLGSLLSGSAASVQAVADANAAATPISWLPQIATRSLPANWLGTTLSTFNTPVGQALGAAGTVYGGYEFADKNVPDVIQNIKSDDYLDAAGNSLIGLANVSPFLLEGVPNLIKYVTELTGDSKVAASVVDDAMKAAQEAAAAQKQAGYTEQAAKITQEGTPQLGDLRAESIRITPDGPISEETFGIKALDPEKYDELVKQIGPENIKDYKNYQGFEEEGYGSAEEMIAAQLENFDFGSDFAKNWALKDPEGFQNFVAADKAARLQHGAAATKTNNKLVEADRMINDIRHEFYAKNNTNIDEINNILWGTSNTNSPEYQWARKMIDDADDYVANHPDLKKIQTLNQEYNTEIIAIDDAYKRLQEIGANSGFGKDFEKALDPEFLKKIGKIYDQTTGKTFDPSIWRSGLKDVSEKLNSSKLVYADKLSESYQSLSVSAKEYLLKNIDSIAGVRLSDETITLGSKAYVEQIQKLTSEEGIDEFIRVFDEYLKDPEAIGGTAVHESGHILQDIYRWADLLKEYNPEYAYSINKDSNPLARAFKAAMVEPTLAPKKINPATGVIDEGSEIGFHTHETWEASVIELHSEMMKARMKKARIFMQEDPSLTVKGVIAKIKKLEAKGDKDLFNFYLNEGDLNKHFKGTTPTKIKTKLLKVLPVGIGVALVGNAMNANAGTEEQSVEGFKKGGATGKKYSRSLEAKNQLYAESKLTKKRKPKNKKIFSPTSNYFQAGGENQVECDDDGRCYETDQVQEIYDKADRLPLNVTNFEQGIVDRLWTDPKTGQRRNYIALGQPGQDAREIWKEHGINNFVEPSCMYVTGLGWRCAPETKNYLQNFDPVNFNSNSRFINAVDRGVVPFTRTGKFSDPSFDKPEKGNLQVGDVVNFKGADNSHAMTFMGYDSKGKSQWFDSNGSAAMLGVRHAWDELMPNNTEKGSDYAYVNRFDSQRYVNDVYGNQIQALEEQARTNPNYVPGTSTSVGTLPIRRAVPLATQESERVLPAVTQTLGMRQFGGIPTLPLNKGRQVLRDWTYGQSIGMLQKANGGMAYAQTGLNLQGIRTAPVKTAPAPKKEVPVQRVPVAQPTPLNLQGIRTAPPVVRTTPKKEVPKKEEPKKEYVKPRPVTPQIAPLAMMDQVFNKFQQAPAPKKTLPKKTSGLDMMHQIHEMYNTKIADAKDLRPKSKEEQRRETSPLEVFTGINDLFKSYTTADQREQETPSPLDMFGHVNDAFNQAANKRSNRVPKRQGSPLDMFGFPEYGNQDYQPYEFPLAPGFSADPTRGTTGQPIEGGLGSFITNTGILGQIDHEKLARDIKREENRPKYKNRNVDSDSWLDNIGDAITDTGEELFDMGADAGEWILDTGTAAIDEIGHWTNMGKRYLQKKGWIDIEEEKIDPNRARKIQPKIEQKPKVDKFYQEIATVKDEGYSDNDLLSYRSQWDNNEGFVYIATPTRKDRTHKEEYSNVRGVGHFLLDASAVPGKEYQHEYNAAFLRKAKENNDWIPTFTPVSGNKVRLKYKKPNEITKEDKVVAPLRQFKFDNIMFDNTRRPEGFEDPIKEVLTKDNKGTYLLFKNKDGYSRFSGGSVVFIFKDKYGNTIVRDFAGTLNNIKDEGKAIKEQYGLKDNSLTIGYHDVGSFSAKPKADSSGVLKSSQWYDFNFEPMTGGALLIPNQ